MFLRPSRQRLVSWIGIWLILLNVLVPTLAHASRGAGGGVPPAMGEWCVAPSLGTTEAPGSVAIDAQAASAERSAGGMLCPFCAGAPVALALASNALRFALAPAPAAVPNQVLVLPHAVDGVPRTGQPRAPPR